MAAPRKSRAKVREPKTCVRPGCGQQFLPTRSDQVFCTVLCKKRYGAYKHVLGPR